MSKDEEKFVRRPVNSEIESGAFFSMFLNVSKKGLDASRKSDLVVVSVR